MMVAAPNPVEARTHKAMNPQTAVIIPVYNAVRALELVLAGYFRQSWNDFELFVADDGSGPEVRSLIDTYAKNAPFPVRYAYQPDDGYRKTRILNQAVRESPASYLIFADADCIPHSNFVAAHCERRRSRTVLCGRRVNLNRRVSDGLTPRDVLDGKLEGSARWRIFDALLGHSGHWDEGFLVRNRTLHRWINRKEPTILGSNFSLDKSLLVEVNGFNEDFVGYSGEDTELEYRLRLAGASFDWVRHLAIQYHLYHVSRSVSQNNATVLQQSRAEGRAVCRNGLRKTSDRESPTSGF
jgi:glycosyltransferase involved in cell wall biosynthesis